MIRLIFILALLLLTILNQIDIGKLYKEKIEWERKYKEADVRYRRQLIKNEMEVCNGKSN